MATVEIIPGEMRLWTDRSSAIRPPAGGDAALALVRSVAGAASSVLLVGSHADEVLQEFDGKDLTVVVRALADADEVASIVPSARVVCGDFSAFAASAGRSWDLVVALDGLERVASNDTPAPAWGARADQLSGLVASGGSLVVGVDNPAALLALADARPPAERRETGDWEPPAATDATRPADLAAALAVFAGAGLTGRGYAASWSSTRPGVLVDVTTAVDAGGVRLRSALRRDRTALAPHVLLFDPVDLLVDRYAAGRAADVASGWILALTSGDTVALPAAILGRTAPGEAAVLDAAAVSTQPDTALVSERAVALTQAEDLPALRGLLHDYFAWIADGGGSDPEATAVTPAGFEALPDGAAVPAGDPGVAAVALLLAHRLRAADLRRIWPPWLDADGITRTLLAMGGRPALSEAAGPTGAPGAGTAEDPLTVVEDVRTLRALNAQLRDELASARGEVFAHERLAANRDRQLENRAVRLARAERQTEAANQRAEHAEQMLAEFNGTLARRLSRAIRHPGLVAAKAKRLIRP